MALAGALVARCLWHPVLVELAVDLVALALLSPLDNIICRMDQNSLAK